MELDSLDHVALQVSDLDASIRWYQEVLGLHRTYREEWGDYPAVLAAGGSGVALFPSDGDAHPAKPPGRDEVAMQHLAFRVSRTGYDAAKAELRARGIDFEERDHRISWSIYLNDPDGFRVEITTYEPDG